MQGRDKNQMNHRPWLIGLVLLLAALFLTMFLLTGWARGADIMYPVTISAPQATGTRHQFITDTVAGVQSAYHSSLPRTFGQILDNTKQHQVRVWYYFDGSAGSDVIVEDMIIDLRRPPARTLASRMYRSPDVDSIGVAHYGGTSTYGLSDSTHVTTLPHAINWSMSQNQAHFVREWWWFSGESLPAIYTWHPVTSDTVVYDTVGTVISPPASANVCRVWGYTRRASGEYVTGVPVRATLANIVDNICDTTITYGQTVLTRSNDSAIFSVDLVRSDCFIGPSGDTVRWKLFVGDRSGMLYVPDSSTYKLPMNWDKQ
jgi:hypothetical protein